MKTKNAYAKCAEIMLILGVGLALATARASAQGSPNTITFENQSGDNAVVKLIGPVRLVTPVPNQTTQTVNVPAGNYYIVTRYCDASGRCTYSQGDPFYVTQTATTYSVISITLHKVANGNYHSSPTTEAAFNGN